MASKYKSSSGFLLDRREACLRVSSLHMLKEGRKGVGSHMKRNLSGWGVTFSGLLLALGGGYAMWTGWDMILLERGWSLFIAGAVALSGGVVTMALGRVIAYLARLTPGPGAIAVPAAPAVASPIVPEEKDTKEPASSLAVPSSRSRDTVTEIVPQEPPPLPREPAQVRQEPLPLPREPLQVPQERLPLPREPVQVRQETPEPAPARPAPREPAQPSRYTRSPTSPRPNFTRAKATEEVSPAAPANETPMRAAAEPTEVDRYTAGDRTYIMMSDGSVEVQSAGGSERYASLAELKERGGLVSR